MDIIGFANPSAGKMGATVFGGVSGRCQRVPPPTSPSHPSAPRLRPSSSPGGWDDGRKPGRMGEANSGLTRSTPREKSIHQVARFLNSASRRQEIWAPSPRIAWTRRTATGIPCAGQDIIIISIIMKTLLSGIVRRNARLVLYGLSAGAMVFPPIGLQARPTTALSMVLPEEWPTAPATGWVMPTVI